MTTPATNIVSLPSSQPTEPAQYLGPFSSPDAFARSMQMARALASSPLVPKDYRGDENLGSVLIALDMASRLNANPLMVMQNLFVIEGRPSWSAQFLIATINSNKRFTPLRFVLSDPGAEVEREVVIGHDWTRSDTGKNIKKPRLGKVRYVQRECYATCRDLKTGEVLDGPVITTDMAASEGWLGKSGSKWQTMPDVMLRYRAAAFWVRMYAPETAMGIQTEDEVRETIELTRDESGSFSVAPISTTDLNASLLASVESARQPTEHHQATDPHPTAEDAADTPDWPRANADGELIDVRGISWDERIHSSSRACNDDGTWRRRRGADPELVERYERAAMDAAVKAKNAELPLGEEESAAADPHPDDHAPSAFEQIRDGLIQAADESEIDAWWDESQQVVISQTQRMALEQARDERRRQLAAANPAA